MSHPKSVPKISNSTAPKPKAKGPKPEPEKVPPIAEPEQSSRRAVKSAVARPLTACAAKNNGKDKSVVTTVRFNRTSVAAMVTNLKLSVAAPSDSEEGQELIALYGRCSTISHGQTVPNRHWRSAVHRMMLFRHVIVEAARSPLMSTEEVVVSLRCIYGAGCDTNHQQWLNSAAKKDNLTVHNQVAGKATPVRFDFRVVANATFGGDRARAGGSMTDSRVIGEQQKQAVFYRMDVYGGDSKLDQRHLAWTVAYSPEDAVRDGDMTTTGIGYVGCRVFRGYLGCDERSTVNKHEAWWFRDHEGYINFRPDEGAPFYPAHPTPDWLDATKSWEGEVDGEVRSLSVSQQKSFGPYTLYRIAVHPRGVFDLDVGKVYVSKGLVECEVIEAGNIQDTLSSRFAYYMADKLSASAPWLAAPGREIAAAGRKTMFMPSVVAQFPTEKLRSLVGTSRLFIEKTITNACALEPAMKICAKYNPELYQEIVHGTILQVMFQKRQDTLDLHCGLQAQASPDDDRMKGLLNGKPIGRPGWRTMLYQTVPALAHYVVSKATQSWLIMPSCVQKTIETAAALSVPDSTAELVKVLICPYTGRKKAITPTPGTVSNDVMLVEFGYDVFDDVVSESGGASRSTRSQAAADFQEATLNVLNRVEHVAWAEGSVRNLAPDATYPRFVNSDTVIRTAALKPGLYGEVRWRWNCHSIPVTDLIDMLAKYQVKPSPIYPLAFVSGSPTAPARHPLNMLAAVYMRILKPQPKWGESVEVTIDGKKMIVGGKQARLVAWESANALLMQTLVRLNIPEATEEECVAAMDGMRGRRLEEAFKMRKEQPESRIRAKQDKKKILLKSDETLRHKTNDDGEVQMRCRAIQAASPLNLAATIQTARNCDKQMHANWNGRVVNMGSGQKHAVRMFYASGSTGEVLDEIGRALASGDTTVAVAGDDSIVGTGNLCANLYIENDMKMYDVSQSDEALNANAKPALKALSPNGEEAFERWLAVAKQNFQIQDRYGKDTLAADGSTLAAILPSGISGTTLVNNLDTAAANLLLLDSVKSDSEDPEKEIRDTTTLIGKQLGLNFETQIHTQLSTATFLKGWWVIKAEPLDEFDVHWVNLPSLILKLGKVLSDPVTSCRGRTKDPLTARYLLARGMWSSNKGIDPAYPILGPYLQQLELITRDCAAGREVCNLENKEYRMFSGTANGSYVAINREEALSSICHRYGTTVAEVEEVEALIRKIDRIPCYVNHPLFNKLAQTDY